AEKGLEEEAGETTDNSQNKEHPEKTNGNIEESLQIRRMKLCLETNLPVEGEENMGEQEEEDMFVKHQEAELSEEEVGRLLQGSKIKTQVKWPKLGTLQCVCPLERFPAVGQLSSAPLPTIHKTLEANWCLLNQSFAPEGGAVTNVMDLQKELLGLMGRSTKLKYFLTSDILIFKSILLLCLFFSHILNSTHTRNSCSAFNPSKVLILVPFRDGVLRVVQTFITLLEPKGKIMDVSNKKRFKEEYGEEPGESPPRLHRPDDYHAVFSGKHVLKHLNLQPLDSHGVDISRVRIWNLNNWAAYYRQMLVFSAIQEPQITNILTKHCHNYRGQVCSKTIPKVGSICQVLVQLPHVFQMFQSDSFMDQDARFQFFVDKILPQYRKEDISFASVSECSQRSEVSRARHFFQKGEKQFMLFSERFHFYKRCVYAIKGIHNLIFYGLPTYPHFYSEVCNMLQAGVREGGGSVSFTCTALYSRYDMHRLAAITGVDRAAQMLQSKKTVHLFITGEEKNT
uniref:UTP25 small subunit processor component n=1 Tax=Cyprinus carpio TaxID=7962 RepID=A0A8C2FN34_CYPCA